MSNPTNVGTNPNDRMPAGKPLDADKIVSEDDAGSASIEREIREERDETAIRDEFEGLDNDLVDVGSFTDQSGADRSSGSVSDEAGKLGLPDAYGIEKSNTLKQP